jgi:hypothetical protein
MGDHSPVGLPGCVGGSTEVEVKEKKERVDDAMHATKAAVELPFEGGRHGSEPRDGEARIEFEPGALDLARVFDAAETIAANFPSGDSVAV